MTRIIDVDVEALAVAWAIADPAVQAVFGTSPVRVAGGLDPTAPAVLPAARLQRVTDTDAVADHLSAVVIQADVWADDKAAAYDGAAALRARLHDPAIVGVHPQGVVTGVAKAQGIRQLEDFAAPHLSRYIFSVRIYAHPLHA